MTQGGLIGQAIQHLCHAHFVGIGLFGAEITSCQCPNHTRFNGRRFHHFINIGFIDNIGDIVMGTPGALFDFFIHGFHHIFGHAMIIITKQIIQRNSR